MPTALEKLSDVLQRSQLTGVSTKDYNAALAEAGFSPDEWYEATLALNNAGYDTGRPSEDNILKYGQQISDQGYGNMSYSPDFDLIDSLTSRGLDPAIAKLGADEKNYFEQADNNYLARTGVKYKNLSPNNTSLLADTVRGLNISGSGSGLDQGKVSGASDGKLMGAGSAEYQSPLIEALRNSSASPYSNNKGITEYDFKPTSVGSPTTVNQTSENSANNPQNLFADIASADDVENWNNYSTYRTNALTAKTPIDSFSKWLSGGKVSGLNNSDSNSDVNIQL